MDDAADKKCTNCFQEHAGIDVCLLGAVAGMVAQRLSEDGSDKTITPELLAQVDVDLFWDKLNPAMHWLQTQIEEGELS